ncbi:MAG TPA: CHAT domain-containing tetratricopeptide repeat protein [Candidatus Eisenbacteria bacterium]|jgi:CHAT domain-containing protein/tetratricopeptide (TPR) repeat protein|nr:CHAT domain-containing tetratricopeptide repeat protein [Candidatus Eisenbacteria bacterium]
MSRSWPRTLVFLALALFVFTGGVSRTSSPHTVRNEDIQARLRAGKFAEAESLARKRLAAVEQESGPESAAVADVLDLLSEAMRQGGKGGQAQVGEICKRAVAIKEKVLGKDDPAYAASLYQLGCWYYMNGEFKTARPLLENSLHIREDKLGPNHLDVASSLFLLGALRTELGDHAGAETLIRRSLTIRKSADPNSPAVAECLSGLGSVLVRMGDYAPAEPLFREAIDLWSRSWGPSHAKVGTGWNNLASVLYATGDYEGALACKEKALSIRVRALGPNHELVGTTRLNMGMGLAALGRKREARRQFEEAVSIYERRFGRDSPEVGYALKRLGDTYLAPGEFHKAVPILERAVSNLVAGDPPDHPDIGEAKAALGSAYTAMGDTARGNELNRQALAILENRLGQNHPEVGYTLTQYANALAVAGYFEPALTTALEGEEVCREHLRLTCRSMPERVALAYAASRPAGGRLALSILKNVSEQSQETLARVWDSLIRSRTLVLDEMTLRMHMASESTNPDTKRLMDNVVAARRHLANLIVSGPGEMTGGQYRAALDKARGANENAERALAARSDAYSDDQKRDRVGLREVASALPPGSALVAYAAAGEGSGRSYVALVARGESKEVIFVPIGSASRIDAAVTRWLAAVSAAGRVSNSSSRVAGDSLASLVWSPVEKRVQGARRLFVVGDGSILLVDFDALPIKAGVYFAEVGPIVHYLNSERDLVTVTSEQASGTGLLALGDPAFDRRSSSPGLARSRGANDGDPGYRDAFDCNDFSSVRFSRLPKSGDEARDIARIWNDAAHTTVLIGARADELSFKKDAPGHRVLHLATHGFFLGGDCETVMPKSRGIGGTSPVGNRPLVKRPVNPTQLSGLALAGANERATVGPDSEDGILTAEEIASLNLSGTDWAVLSACDTGRGKIQVGEGVLGLRRAFQVAGARTVIMSLWAVDDASTREWMEALYHGRVVEKLDTADAVRQANLHVLRARRAQARSTDPFHWAGFVATGDWR